MTEEYDIFADLEAFCGHTRRIIKDDHLLDTLPDVDFPKDEDDISSPVVEPASSKKRKNRKKLEKSVEKQIKEILKESPINISKRKSKVSKAKKSFSKKRPVTRSCSTVNNMEAIDLTTNPMVSVTETIFINSDDENVTSNKPVIEEESFDLENPELSIKINWCGKIEIFRLRKYQKFREIFKIIAEREKANLNDLVFNIGNKIVTETDSPASVDYQIFHFIYGRIIITENTKNTENENKIYRKQDPNKICLKIQSDRWKRPNSITLNRTDTFKILCIKLSEELAIPCNEFKLFFDGEALQYSETPNDIQLDGGEIIDCVFKK